MLPGDVLPGEGVQVWDAVRLRRRSFTEVSGGQIGKYLLFLRSRGEYLLGDSGIQGNKTGITIFV